MSEQIKKEQKEQRFRIFSMSESLRQDEPMFWSNKHGWVSINDSDSFTSKENDALNLPFMASSRFLDDVEWIDEEQVKNTIAKFNAKFLYTE